MTSTRRFAALVVASALLVGCSQESDVASFNVSQAAHNFEVNRRVVA